MKNFQIKLCYFNGHWNVYIYTNGGYNSWIDNKQEQIKVDGIRGEYRLRTYSHPDIPIHSFGFWCYDPKSRPGHGGEWSSNSGAVNNVFGTELWEVAIDHIAVAVPLSWLKEQLGDQVEWAPDNIWREKITSVKGVENVWHNWTEIKLTA